jgi:hypothetical protein
VNHHSGHLLTPQSPPQLWHLAAQPLAEMRPGSDEGWSCHFLSDTTPLARGEKPSPHASPSPIRASPPPWPLAENHRISADLIATAYSRNSLTTPDAAIDLWQSTQDGVVKNGPAPPS